MKVGIVGATSMLASLLINKLKLDGVEVIALSRGPAGHANREGQYFSLDDVDKVNCQYGSVSHWILTSPITAVGGLLTILSLFNARRVIALSSTSLITKQSSVDAFERQLAQDMKSSEAEFVDWASRRGVEWFIIRPTMIYGKGLDRNITEIVKFIEKFRVFPLYKGGRGLRQPIYIDDVVSTCERLLDSKLKNCAVNVCGGNSISYYSLVKQVYVAMNRKPLIITLPLPVLKIGLYVMRRIKNADLTVGMILRQNEDMTFKQDKRIKGLGLKFRPFKLSSEDLRTSDFC